ncbi:hypothetical protein GALMADRAFT_138884 [Galerina marginata CBS 339.88]|uniref:Uncharacterized protein n=1 Tax=Galerina marginata (strain CBS 339.88) TaxID=685588 RepID=A0A067TFT8_GALM3|nr:hypothetical protein GALMADRAFT_138884 [Galerina marginata CBS 339.88]
MVFNPYSLLHELQPLSRPAKINDLSFSRCSRFLACAGNNYIAVWDTETGDLLQHILVKVPVISIIWHKGKDDCILFGCDDGTICSISDFDPNVENKAHPVLTDVAGIVYSLGTCVGSDYVAIAVGSDIQVAKQITNESYAAFVVMPPPFALPIVEIEADDRIRASAVHLTSGGSRLVASYLNHGIICWDITLKMSLWTIIPGHRHRHIGSSVLSPNSDHILVFNLRDGMDLYEFGNSIPTQSYRYSPNAESNYTTKLGFLNDGRSVICGAQDSRVRIWDTKSGIQQQILPHDLNLIQALACYQGRQYSFIATADASANPLVKIWRAQSEMVETDTFYGTICFPRKGIQTAA